MVNFLEKRKIVKTDQGTLDNEFLDIENKWTICYVLKRMYDIKNRFPNGDSLYTAIDLCIEKLGYEMACAEQRMKTKRMIKGLSKKDSAREIKSTLSEIKYIKKSAKESSTLNYFYKRSFEDKAYISKYNHLARNYDYYMSNAKEMVDYIYKKVEKQMVDYVHNRHDVDKKIMSVADEYVLKVYGFRPELRESRTL